MGIREIIFRGKRKDNGEWIEGYYCNCVKAVGAETIPSIQQTDDNSLYFREIIPETVSQYIGLDMNGKKIFEGDIVKIFWCKGDNVTSIGDIRYSETHCSFLWYIEGLFPCGFDTTKMEVIGNIHDNPELLGE